MTSAWKVVRPVEPPQVGADSVVHLLNRAAHMRRVGDKPSARHLLALAWIRARYPEAKHAVRLADLSSKLVAKLPPNIVRMFWN